MDPRASRSVSSGCPARWRYVSSPSCSRSSFLSSRSIPRTSPLSRFIADFALPSGVLGPVLRVHGCQRRIASDCLSRRSCVQPFAIDLLQKFGWLDFAFPARGRAEVVLLRSGRDVGLSRNDQGGFFIAASTSRVLVH